MLHMLEKFLRVIVPCLHRSPEMKGKNFQAALMGN